MNSSALNSLRLAAAVALATAGSSFAQTTATTDPVGFITHTFPAGTATTPSYKSICIPLYSAAVFQSAASAVTSSTCTLTGANFTANQFTSAPHLLRVKSGAQVGRFFLITANTANAVTIDTRGGTVDLTSFVATNDKCEILPANTLGSLFGTTTTIFQTALSPNSADNLYLWNGASWDAFYHNGTNWRKAGSSTNQNNTIVYPDEGLFVARRGTSALNFSPLGTVPTTNERTDLDGAGSTYIANRFPVNIQLVDTGLQLTANWVTGGSPNSADKVYIWNGTSWDVFYHNGTNWRKAGSSANQNTTVVPVGTPMFVTKSGSGATLAQNLPYIP
jgi:uncharacterized protein (TIGR02597 family)